MVNSYDKQTDPWRNHDDDGWAAITRVESALPLRALVAVSASIELVISGLPSDAETVTIDGNVYTFKTALTPTAGEVLIGVSATTAGDNLVAAMTGGAGSGTTYAAGTTPTTTITPVNVTGTVTMTAATAGYAGNSIVVGEAATNVAYNPVATVLSGGLDGVDLSPLPKALYVSTAGDLQCLMVGMADDDPITFAVITGLLPIRVRRILGSTTAEVFCLF